jgi:hypothetical protein
MQLRFTSFAMICLRRNFHLQEVVHAGRTIWIPAFAEMTVYRALRWLEKI